MYRQGAPEPARGSDRYRPQQSNEHDRQFTFRGASSQNQGYERRHEFSFRSTGPPAPAFAPETRHSNGATSARRGGKDYSSRGRRSVSTRSSHDNSRGRRFGPRPAHERDILNRDHRSVTPELLEGMNSQPTFKNPDDVSSSSESDGPRKKRARLDVAASAERPKWSNPDPYTALPPPDASNGLKIDIVQTIRKAKLEAAKNAASKNNVVKNDDFISFDFDNKSDVEDEVDQSSQEPGEISDGDGFIPMGPDQRAQFRDDFTDYLRDNGLDTEVSGRHEPDTRMPQKPSFATMGRYETTYQNVSRDSAQHAQSRKRKRFEEYQDPEVVPDWLAQSGGNGTPWLRKSTEMATDTGLR